MKNYKNLVPIILVVLFFLGIYVKYDKNTDVLDEYNTYLGAARNYRELGIAVDAESNYLEAVDVKPNLNLYIEIGEFYKECVGSRSAMSWAEEIVEVYPEEVKGYEFVLGLYKELDRYEDFFELYDTAKKRGLASDTIIAYVDELKSKYYLDGDYEDIGSYAGGYCKVYDEGYWAFVTEKGKEVTKFEFVQAGNFCDGVVPVESKIGEKFLADSDGNKKYVIENIENIVSIGSFDEEVCTIYDGSTWGVYTLKGERLHGGYSKVSALGNGVIAVENKGKWSLLDYEGNTLINETFDSVKSDEKGIVYRNDRIFVETNGKYSMIDLEGNQISKDTYEDVRIFNGDEYAAVKVNEKWGFINKDGEVVIKPQYEDARSFSNGYAAVKKGYTWGFVDVNNEIFIDYMFSETKDFTVSGSVFVKIGTWKLLRLYSYN